MARLSAGPRNTAPRPAPPRVEHHCDNDRACGHARFRVILSRGPESVGAELFFCGHHFRKHRLAFFERGYEIVEL